MYRYDLLFSNIKTEAFDWIVGFVSLEAARAYADHLRNARQDDNIVCALYARTEEGDFHRYQGDGFDAEPKPEPDPEDGKRYLVVSVIDSTIVRSFEDLQSAKVFMDSRPGKRVYLRTTVYPKAKNTPERENTKDGFHPVPTPDDVKYRYLVVSKVGPVIAQEFEDRQSAQGFIESHPGLLLRFYAERIDGFAFAPQSPSSAKASRSVSKSADGSDAARRSSISGHRANPGEHHRERTKPDDSRPQGKGVSPLLAGAAGFGIGALAAGAAAKSTGEEASPELASLTALSAFGDDNHEGASADAAFAMSAGKGVSDELAALTALSALGDSADTEASADLFPVGGFLDDHPSYDEESMNATQSVDIFADRYRRWASDDDAGLEDDYNADDGGDNDDIPLDL
ncbi:MAG: hypothetical protein ISN28_01945 [Ectothiorhodospiraceae bacterium AqS1]|nr:hypothetical protein [Ectothiorhodospiraceae bacterium AqS1]